jgi:hypothetical protein
MSLGYICRSNKASWAVPSTRRSVRFLVALYAHALLVMILVIFSRNMFSRAVRTLLLPLLS